MMELTGLKIKQITVSGFRRHHPLVTLTNEENNVVFSFGFVLHVNKKGQARTCCVEIQIWFIFYSIEVNDRH